MQVAYGGCQRAEDVVGEHPEQDDAGDQQTAKQAGRGIQTNPGPVFGSPEDGLPDDHEIVVNRDDKIDRGHDYQGQVPSGKGGA